MRDLAGNFNITDPGIYPRILFLSLLVLISGATLRAQPACTVQQITDDSPLPGTVSGDSQSPDISAAGDRVAFVSSSNLTGSNPDGNFEVFLFDGISQTVTQVTDTVIPANHLNAKPNLSGNGAFLAFVSEADLTGGNPAGSGEIFIFDIGGTSFQQVTTSTLAQSNDSPRLSAAGDRLVFVSDADFVGTNADQSTEVFSFLPATAVLEQLTDSVGPLKRQADISGDGTRVVFNATDFPATNPDGSLEIFLLELATNTVTQLTDFSPMTAFASSPKISADGQWFSFRSDQDPLGTNPDGSTELFVQRIGGSQPIQVTDALGFPSIRAERPLSADGRRIGFSAQVDPLGSNPDGSPETFLFDRTAQSILQLSDVMAPQFAFGAVLSASGSHVAFYSDGDLVGNNADGSEEIFLAVCPLPPSAEIPTLGLGGLLLLALLLALAAATLLRRRGEQALHRMVGD